MQIFVVPSDANRICRQAQVAQAQVAQAQVAQAQVARWEGPINSGGLQMD